MSEMMILPRFGYSDFRANLVVFQVGNVYRAHKVFRIPQLWLCGVIRKGISVLEAIVGATP